jgi:hypothetical protein
VQGKHVQETQGQHIQSLQGKGCEGDASSTVPRTGDLNFYNLGLERNRVRATLLFLLLLANRQGFQKRLVSSRYHSRLEWLRTILASGALVLISCSITDEAVHHATQRNQTILTPLVWL